MEDDGMISNTREYSRENILEKNRLFWNNKDQSGVMKRKAVDRAQTANQVSYKGRAYGKEERKEGIVTVPHCNIEAPMKLSSHH